MRNTIISVVVLAFALFLSPSTTNAATDTASMIGSSSMGETNYVPPSADPTLTNTTKLTNAPAKPTIKPLTKADSTQKRIRELGFKSQVTGKAMKEIFIAAAKAETDSINYQKTHYWHHADQPSMPTLMAIEE